MTACGLRSQFAWHRSRRPHPCLRATGHPRGQRPFRPKPDVPGREPDRRSPRTGIPTQPGSVGSPVRAVPGQLNLSFPVMVRCPTVGVGDASGTLTLACKTGRGAEMAARLHRRPETPPAGPLGSNDPFHGQGGCRRSQIGIVSGRHVHDCVGGGCHLLLELIHDLCAGPPLP